MAVCSSKLCANDRTNAGTNAPATFPLQPLAPHRCPIPCGFRLIDKTAFNFEVDRILPLDSNSNQIHGDICEPIRRRTNR